MPTFKNEVTAAGQVGIHGISKTKHGVVGEAKQDGSGLVGISDLGAGVSGTSNSASGVAGVSDSGAGVSGSSNGGTGVIGSSGGGSGVVGQSDRAPAVRGISKSSRGVEGMSQSADGLFGHSESGNGATGISRTGHGVLGQSENASGLRGLSRTGRGVEGWSETAYGVSGDSATSAGVRGTSQRGRGVEGWSTSAEGVFGICEGGIGVYGVSGRSRFFRGIGEFVPSDIGLARDIPPLAVPPLTGPGQDLATLRQRDEPAFHHLHETSHKPSPMHAEAAHVGKTASAVMERGFVAGPGSIHEEVSISDFHDDRAGIGVLGEHRRAGIGVKAMSDKGFGLAAYSTGHEAIHAETRSRETAAIAAYNLNPNGTGAAIFAKKEGRRGHAGFFVGNVWITGELGVGGDIMLANADCAEDFDVVGATLAEPGTVMVMGADGLLLPCNRAYDKRVAGVISGAGHFKPGVILDKRETAHERCPVALLGKVFCKVTTAGGAIQVGDLLTTSDTPGHAMKAGDPHLAFGSVIGKALATLEADDGLIPILVALQ